MTHDDDTQKIRDRAEATAKARAQQKQDAPVAMKEYRLAEQAERDKIRKLREARLARAQAAEA